VRVFIVWHEFIYDNKHGFFGRRPYITSILPEIFGYFPSLMLGELRAKALS